MLVVKDSKNAPISAEHRNDNRSRRCAKALSVSSATDEGDFLIKGLPQFLASNLISLIAVQALLNDGEPQNYLSLFVAGKRYVRRESQSSE